jgi:hypothetical protein
VNDIVVPKWPQTEWEDAPTRQRCPYEFAPDFAVLACPKHSQWSVVEFITKSRSVTAQTIELAVRHAVPEGLHSGCLHAVPSVRLEIGTLHPFVRCADTRDAMALSERRSLSRHDRMRRTHLERRNVAARAKHAIDAKVA